MKPRPKTVTIIVEGTPHEWAKKDISYDEVVQLEIPSHTPESTIRYLVNYERGNGNKPQGTLTKGSSVKVKNRMVFHVSETGES